MSFGYFSPALNSRWSLGFLGFLVVTVAVALFGFSHRRQANTPQIFLTIESGTNVASENR